MKIGIDIDGVILDYERTMNTYAELYDLLILKKDGKKHPQEFSPLKKYDWTEEERKAFVNTFYVYATINLTPFIPMAKEMLELFQAEGYDYVFITARGTTIKETKPAVIEVFKRNNLSVDNIYWAVEEKVPKCKELGIDLMIEDNPSTCKKLKENKIKVLYFRDKNSEVIPEDEYLTEVSSVGDICRYLFKINGFNNSKEVYKRILLKNDKKKITQ